MRNAWKGLFLITFLWFATTFHEYLKELLSLQALLSNNLDARPREISPNARKYSHRHITAFWHVNNNEPTILDMHFEIINSTMYRNHGLVVNFVVPEKCQLNSVEYRPTLDTMTKLSSTPRFFHTPRTAEFNCRDGYVEHYEGATLRALWDFCWVPANEHSVVTYLHTKSNSTTRKRMLDSLLGERAFESCYSCMNNSSKCVCGYSPMTAHRGPCGPERATWCHFSGNFWASKCSYIRRLHKPEPFRLQRPQGVPIPNNSFHTHASAGDVRPSGRYFWEWWLLNDIKPSSPGEVLNWWGLTRYSFGYWTSRVTFSQLYLAGLVELVAGSEPSWRLPRLFQRRGPFCINKTESIVNYEVDGKMSAWLPKLRNARLTHAGELYVKFLTSMPKAPAHAWQELCPALGKSKGADVLKNAACVV